MPGCQSVDGQRLPGLGTGDTYVGESIDPMLGKSSSWSNLQGKTHVTMSTRPIENHDPTTNGMATP